jgi:hypothetical protein
MEMAANSQNGSAAPPKTRCFDLIERQFSLITVCECDGIRFDGRPYSSKGRWNPPF